MKNIFSIIKRRIRRAIFFLFEEEIKEFISHGINYNGNIFINGQKYEYRKISYEIEVKQGFRRGSHQIDTPKAAYFYALEKAKKFLYNQSTQFIQVEPKGFQLDNMGKITVSLFVLTPKYY